MSIIKVSRGYVSDVEKSIKTASYPKPRVLRIQLAKIRRCGGEICISLLPDTAQFWISLWRYTANFPEKELVQIRTRQWCRNQSLSTIPIPQNSLSTTAAIQKEVPWRPAGPT